jgi:hypothetical protein
MVAYLIGEYSQFQGASQPPKVPSIRIVWELKGDRQSAVTGDGNGS